MSFLDRPGPRWFTIPAHRPFVEDLAAGLLGLAQDRPDALADAVVLLPNRRAGRALTEAFAAGEGRPVLLPEIRALGDLEQYERPFEPGALGLSFRRDHAARRRFAWRGWSAPTPTARRCARWRWPTRWAASSTLLMRRSRPSASSRDCGRRPRRALAAVGGF